MSATAVSLQPALRDVVHPQFHQNNFSVEKFIKNELGLKLDKGALAACWDVLYLADALGRRADMSACVDAGRLPAGTATLSFETYRSISFELPTGEADAYTSP
jgi:hypothetical protein